VWDRRVVKTFLDTGHVHLLFSNRSRRSRCEGLSVWHEPAWASRGRYGEVLLGGRFFGEIGVADSGGIPVSNLDDPLFASVCAVCVC
jgi:hypothetical protein